VGIVGPAGAEEPFNLPWPGPGNSEGPVDPDPSAPIPARGGALGGGWIEGLVTTLPWPGPGDSEA
jgi:hypothetical protein